MADAPRFRAYFQYAEGRPVLHMPRKPWSSLNVSSTDTALLDVANTPMGSISSKASVVAAYGRRYSASAAEVGIVRYDPADAPTVYNVDKYDVLEDLPSHRSFGDMVTAASTQDNANLREYLRENVFFVKRDPDEEHHRSELPGTLKLLLDSST